MVERQESRKTPAVGTVMFDTARKKLGEYRDKVGTHFYLRPIGGGQEWTADPKHVREATSLEMLSVRVAAANARSRGEIS